MPKSQINALIPGLKDAGATDIIELPLSKIVTEVQGGSPSSTRPWARLGEADVSASCGPPLRRPRTGRTMHVGRSAVTRFARPGSGNSSEPPQRGLHEPVVRALRVWLGLAGSRPRGRRTSAALMGVDGWQPSAPGRGGARRRWRRPAREAIAWLATQGRRPTARTHRRRASASCTGICSAVAGSCRGRRCRDRLPWLGRGPPPAGLGDGGLVRPTAGQPTGSCSPRCPDPAPRLLPYEPGQTTRRGCDPHPAE